MTLDAVVGLIQSAPQVGSGIGELKALAIAPVIGAGFQFDQRAFVHLVSVHQVLHVELMGNLEENSSAMVCFAGRRQGSPGCIQTSQFQMPRVLGFGLQPAVHMRCETELG